MLRKLSPLALLLAACAGGEGAGGSAESAINGDSLMAAVRVLSSDEFEGRAPGTLGEEKTVAYLTERFKGLGLAPGNPDGSWVQNVGMVGITPTSETSVTVGGKTLTLKFPDDIVVATLRHLEQVEVPSSDIVFVGYGIEAPEYGWDDFKGTDVKGKTLIMLVNDPPLPDSTMFRGIAMTYYGRWTYKYEQASAKGAAAAIIVHETGPAGYPWEVVVGSRGRENIDIARENKNAGRVPIEGWIQLEKARELFKAAGEDFDALHTLAATREFKPVALKAKAHFRVKASLRQFSSRNVVAKLEGSDPALKDEYVIYSAHWDHLGRDTTRQGDQIFNGALDNASGTAGLLEIAKAFKDAQSRAQAEHPLPRRHRGGEGTARRQVLRRESALPAQQDSRRHQHGRRQPVGKDQRHHRHRARQFDARRCAARGRHSPWPHASARSGTGEGLLLSFRSFRVRQEGRARALHRRRHRVRRQAAGVRRGEAGRVPGQRLSLAVGRDQAGMGFFRWGG
jgi:hypothetical protein